MSGGGGSMCGWRGWEYGGVTNEYGEVEGASVRDKGG